MKRLGKIWKINTYTVLPNKIEEHDKITNKLITKWKQISPEKQFWYFRQRFYAPGERVTVVDGFDTISDWEKWLQKCNQDEEYNKITPEWYATIDQSSFRTLFWDKRALE